MGRYCWDNNYNHNAVLLSFYFKQNILMGSIKIRVGGCPSTLVFFVKIGIMMVKDEEGRDRCECLESDDGDPCGKYFDRVVNAG